VRQRTIYEGGPQLEAISHSFQLRLALIQGTYEDERNKRQDSTTFTRPSDSNGTDRGTEDELKLTEQNGWNPAYGVRQHTLVEEMLQISNDSDAFPHTLANSRRAIIESNSIQQPGRQA
jgi:hypothetical protein